MTKSLSFIKFTYHLSLFIGATLLLASCTRNYKIELADPIKYGGDMWQGYFLANNGTRIPFAMGIREESPMVEGRQNLNGAILSGHDLYTGFISLNKDSIRMRAGLHGYLLGKKKGDKIEGVLMDGVTIQHPKAPFVLHKSDKPRFRSVSKPTNISATGRWILNFGTLKDLSDMKELLRYNIDRATKLDLYREGDKIMGKTYIHGAGVQGFDGIMTGNGFKCASYHHTEPFLLEATFIDENHFEATITSITDIYKVRGTREDSKISNTSYTTSVLQGFFLTVKGFFKW